MQELNQISKKLERCITIEQKKKYLETKLEEHEIIFEESEYFDMIDELKDATFNELFTKFRQVEPGFAKTSRWLNASEDDKALLGIMEVIPSKFPTMEELSAFKSQQHIRQYILSSSVRYKFFQKIMSFKKGEIPPSQLIIDIISDVFSMFYAGKVNVFLREEYQKLIPKSDYQLAEIIESSNEVSLSQIEWQGTQGQLAELFVELQRKGWINSIPTKLISRYFTNSKSINQVLKPAQDPRTKENTYEGIYKPKYSPRFDAIRQNV